MGHKELLLNDSYRFFERARSFAEPGFSIDWVHPYYSFGYPLLIGLLTKLTGDAFVSARIVSVAAAIGFLVVLYRLIRAVGASGWLAAFILLEVGTVFDFLQLASFDNTDMLGCFLMLLAFFFASKEPTQAHPYRNATIAGLWLGVAYMVRYTSLTLLPAMLLYFAWSAWEERQVLWKPALYCFLGFLAMASPQLLASIIEHGNPFWNKQINNVAFAVVGNNNWGLNWSETEQYGSISEVIRAHPAAFFKNYFTNFFKVFIFNKFGWPVQYLFWPGLAALAIYRFRIFMILGLSLLLFGAAVSLAFVTPRTGFFLLPIYAIAAAAGLASLARQHVLLQLSLCLSLVLLSESQLRSIKDFLALGWQGNAETNTIALSQNLTSAGMKNEAEVLSLNWAYYNSENAYKIGYSMPWSYEGEEMPINSSAKLRYLMAKRGYKFIVADGNSINQVMGLASWWPWAQLGQFAKPIFSVGQTNAWAWNTANNTGWRMATEKDFTSFLLSNKEIKSDFNTLQMQETFNCMPTQHRKDLARWLDYKAAFGIL